MSTKTHDDQKLVAEISRIVIQEIAPEELILFDEIVQDYFLNPNQLKQTSTKNPLAFGVDEVLIAVTPAVIASVVAVIEFVKVEVIKNVQEKSDNAKLQAILIREAKKHEQDLFTIEQLEVIKTIIKKQAEIFGLNPKEAKVLAESIIGILALKAKEPSKK